MNFCKLIFSSLYISSIFLNSKKVLADETYVICANQNKNWEWLEKGNIKVRGTWKLNIIKNGFYNHFILDERIVKYSSLTSQCIREFGSDYIYAQPSNHAFSNWTPFSLDDKQILPGHISFIQTEYYLRVYDKM